MIYCSNTVSPVWSATQSPDNATFVFKIRTKLLTIKQPPGDIEKVR